MNTNNASPPSATVLMILIENDTLVAENLDDGRRRLGGFMALREAVSWCYIFS